MSVSCRSDVQGDVNFVFVLHVFVCEELSSETLHPMDKAVARRLARLHFAVRGHAACRKVGESGKDGTVLDDVGKDPHTCVQQLRDSEDHNSPTPFSSALGKLG